MLNLGHPFMVQCPELLPFQQLPSRWPARLLSDFFHSPCYLCLLLCGYSYHRGLTAVTSLFLKWKVKWKSLSHGLYSSWNSPGQNTGVGSLSLLQGIFLTQRLNLGLSGNLSHPGSVDSSKVEHKRSTSGPISGNPNHFPKTARILLPLISL